MDSFLASEFQNYIILFLLSAVISYGCVEVVKLFVDGYLNSIPNSIEPWWHKPICRFLSLFFGALCGIYGGTTYIHYAIGISAGILNTFVVALVKQRIKKKIGSE